MSVILCREDSATKAFRGLRKHALQSTVLETQRHFTQAQVSDEWKATLDASVRGLQATCAQTKKRENREFQSGPRFMPFLYIRRDDVTHGDVLLDAITSNKSLDLICGCDTISIAKLLLITTIAVWKESMVSFWNLKPLWCLKREFNRICQRIHPHTSPATIRRLHTKKSQHKLCAPVLLPFPLNAGRGGETAWGLALCQRFILSWSPRPNLCVCLYLLISAHWMPFWSVGLNKVVIIIIIKIQSWRWICYNFSMFVLHMFHQFLQFDDTELGVEIRKICNIMEVRKTFQNHEISKLFCQNSISRFLKDSTFRLWKFLRKSQELQDLADEIRCRLI